MINDILLTFLLSVSAFIYTYLVIPSLIKKLKDKHIVGLDMNKNGRHMIPRMGGVAIAFGYIGGSLTLFLFIPGYTMLLAALCTILMVCMMGLIDDLLDLSQFVKAILPLPAAIPLIVVLSSDRTMLLPFIGPVHLGLIYPLIMVPIGVAVASNLTNMLAGFNGLETGIGAIASASLMSAALLSGKNMSAFVAAPTLGACIAFLIFNRYPAKIFPGNSGSYIIGATIAAAVVLGDMEFAGVIILMPQIIEFFIKARNRFSSECFGVADSQGILSPPNPRNNGSITHLIMRFGRFTEPQLVRRIFILQIIFGVIANIVVYFSLYYYIVT